METRLAQNTKNPLLPAHIERCGIARSRLILLKKPQLLIDCVCKNTVNQQLRSIILCLFYFRIKISSNQFCLKLFSSITPDQIAESLAIVSCMVCESV